MAPPQPTYSSFTYTQLTSDVYATPLSTSVSFPTPFAPPFSKASTLLPSGVTYTTYSYDPSATITPDELALPPALYNAPPDTSLKLPADFLRGVSSSSWQIEGALQLEGRGPSVLDSIGYALAPETADRSDANVANMHYFMYEQDIARLAAAGIPHYSFSLSWSRIVPFGVAGSPINSQGLDHYDHLINTCLTYGVTPIITLNHVDAPTAVQADLKSLPEHFLYYAKIVTTRKGQITLKFANNLAMPLDTQNISHVAAAFRYQDILLGIMSNPLFLGKQYPDAAINTPGVIEPLTNDQLKHIHGKIDFWSFDPYTAQHSSPLPQGTEACASNSSDPLWPTCNTFRPSGILIAEYGFNTFLESNRTLDAQRYDLERTLYYQDFLTETLKAIHEDGINVIWALAWSLADNNEFGSYEE
ncbi:hypothetical protein ETB97_007885 [Aspergillus alliaceus]|uniref:Beta-glucosidase n=1 Tax=Petromyces alliaceus TaxID=209559 RepID=A0A8H5ZXG2_PETAA|nr:hypothetical protein ETB97_007885 [Aspergillus burnettii]